MMPTLPADWGEFSDRIASIWCPSAPYGAEHFPPTAEGNSGPHLTTTSLSIEWFLLKSSYCYVPLQLNSDTLKLLSKWERAKRTRYYSSVKVVGGLA